MSDIELHVVININNKKEFRQSAVDYGCKADANMDEMVKKIGIEPDEKPSKHGYEIASMEVKSKSGKTHTIKVGINVTDEGAMVKEAINCYSGAWQDDEWKPETLGQAAFELLCGSNERPSPDTLGFEYADWTYPKDRPVDPQYLIEEKNDENEDEDDELRAAPGL